ncbi:hypothetical protein HPP92_027825 [Vanilla planifolia]|uniref:Uncharacterized protein n=1 Tax=Vanilla planifolia TaxID=51239 RepID=A0A835U3R6_VANPL|nr:hypothetical protein HPP92_027825 [Vanilla planifolia]
MGICKVDYGLKGHSRGVSWSSRGLGLEYKECVTKLSTIVEKEVNEDFKRKIEEDVCGCEKKASAFWDLQPRAAQEHAMSKVSSTSKDLIEKELPTFNWIS